MHGDLRCYAEDLKTTGGLRPCRSEGNDERKQVVKTDSLSASKSPQMHNQLNSVNDPRNN